MVGEQTNRAPDERRSLWSRPVVIAGLVIAITFGHAAVPVSRQALHDLFIRLYYIPIALGGLWFGLRGGLGAAALVLLVFLPHVFLVDHGRLTFGYLLETPVFVGIGILTGLIVDRQMQFRRGLEAQAETLARSHKELQDQTKLLLEKEAQLRRADRLSALGQLSAGLAHEIRNPLGAIKGAVEILEEDYPPGHPKAEFYDIIIKEVKRLNDVVTNFLSFARPVSRRFDSVDVREIVTGLEGLISGQARAHQVQIFTSFHDGPSHVLADEALLKQAFLNIMLNALEAMPDGGDLTVATRLADPKTSVLPDGAEQGAWLEVVFDDTGVGISDEWVGRIFDPFFTTKKDGTGLGLAITYRILENHGGTIRVTSQSGRGTTFVVALPLQKVPTHEA